MPSAAEFTPVKIWVPEGSLGSGVFPEEVEVALERRPHAIALDAGSTDSGAAYLAKGISKNNRGTVKRSLTMIMEARERAGGIPLLIGTCGQAGGDLNVDWTRDIVLEICREKGYAPKIALLYSEQSPQLIKRKLAEGKISNLPPTGDLNDETIDSCLHIVALMGPEPYFAALEAGADIILGGRGTDPAVIAAFALWKGAPAGPTWHAGKIGECGGQASTASNGQKGMFFEIHADGFDVEPLTPTDRATVESISAHLIYENKDPWVLTEPGGQLDVTGSKYEQLTDTKVRVTGSVWNPKPYTMKLEGASGRVFQTIMISGVTEPEVLADPQRFHDKMVYQFNKRVKAVTDLKEGEYHISIRMFGWNAVSGVVPPPDTPKPRELGIMCVMTAPTQEQASQMAKACNPYFLHMPIRGGIEMPSYGFQFTPADIDRGPVYQFELNHVVHVDDPLELVRMEFVEVAATNDKVKVNA